MERCLPVRCRRPQSPSQAPGSTAHGGFSFATGAAFSVNYILGTGFLALPQAFAASGLLLSPLLVVAVALVMNVTKDYLLEALSRGEALSQLPQIATREWQRRWERRADSENLHEGGMAAVADLRGALLAPTEADGLLNGKRKLEVGDLIAVMFGSSGRTAWAVLLSIYIYGALWAYTSVFASSFAANVPLPVVGEIWGSSQKVMLYCTALATTPFLGDTRTRSACAGTCDVNMDAGGCTTQYLLWVAVFAAISIGLACRDLKEQVFVQLLMFAARVIVILLLTMTIAGSAACNGVSFARVPPSHGKSVCIFSFSSVR